MENREIDQPIELDLFIESKANYEDWIANNYWYDLASEKSRLDRERRDALPEV